MPCKKNVSTKDFLSTKSRLIFYRNGLESYTKKYSFGRRAPGSYLDKVIWDIKDEREFVILFTELCGLKNYMAKAYLWRYENTLESTENILKLLAGND